MEKKESVLSWKHIFTIVCGSALYSLGFAMFLFPNSISGGGVSGLGLIFITLTQVGSVGSFVLICNIPLFVLGYKQFGKHFFYGSLIGMLASSILIDVFAYFPPVYAEPLLAAICGGAIVGIGLGLVFGSDASTGGVDIIVRLLKRKIPHMSVGRILLM